MLAGWSKSLQLMRKRPENAWLQLPGWTLGDGALRRKFTFGGFPEALAFVVRLGFAAEAADHHPDMLMNYKRVTLTYVTHSARGSDRQGLRRRGPRRTRGGLGGAEAAQV